MPPSEKSALKQYYVRDRGKIYGPFDRSFIDAADCTGRLNPPNVEAFNAELERVGTRY